MGIMTHEVVDDGHNDPRFPGESSMCEGCDNELRK